MAHASVTVAVGGLTFDVGAARDLSVPVRFDQAHARAFGLVPATSSPAVAGLFVGDVRRGGSCNCEVHTLTPHADGTHTEGPGHLLAERRPVVVRDAASLAVLVHVTPRALGDTPDEVSGNHRHDDRVVCAADLEDALTAALAGAKATPTALVIKTGSGQRARTATFSGTNPPYLTVDAAALARERGVVHLLVDLPSIDREDDGGLLGAHRAFFGLPRGLGAAGAAGRDDDPTVTELIAVDDDLAPGLYALLLMTAPLVSDAVPSRPLLCPHVTP